MRPPEGRSHGQRRGHERARRRHQAQPPDGGRHHRAPGRHPRRQGGQALHGHRPERRGAPGGARAARHHAGDLRQPGGRHAGDGRLAHGRARPAAQGAGLGRRGTGEGLLLRTRGDRRPARARPRPREEPGGHRRTHRRPRRPGMSTPQQADPRQEAAAPPEPQPVLNPLTRAAIFLVVAVSEGGEPAARDLLGDLAALQRSVGFRAPDDTLACVAGVGSRAWDRLFAGPRPGELHPFRELAGSRHRAVATAGDLVFHIRAEQMGLCFELATHVMERLAGAVTVCDEVHGFRYFDDRDLLGFVDGTENPTGRASVAAAITGAGDPGLAGGSYLIVQKYVHDMGAWNALSVEEQERVIGRTKLDDIELPDEVKPSNSHVAVNTITEPDGTERQIVRANMPFGSVGAGAFGTYYAAYSATPTVTERMLERMFIGDPPGSYDRILDFSTAVTGNLFFAPSADFLDDLPAAPLDRSAPAMTSSPSTPPSAPAADGSLGIGGLKRSSQQ